MEPPAQSDVAVATNTTSPPSADLKRKRSPSNDAHAHPAPPPKAQKTHNHLQINYLARQYQDDLPLISNDDSLPNIIRILNEYQGVLDRHESLACNLGARPLGPILIKRFERLFDGPPKVLKSHGKEGTTVTWLDVVEFARNKPEQFTLGQMSEGVRVCQFYTKQCRVQISEEDYVLISSGLPQKLIPPQPIVEDEEKELGTIEILEKNLVQIRQMADSVAGLTRALIHRIGGRKKAIIDRRATDSPAGFRAASPSNVALMNGAAQNASAALATLSQAATQSPSSGFVAVNSRPVDVNGDSKNGASPATRSELLSKFFTLSDRRNATQTSNGDIRGRPSTASALSTPSTKAEYRKSGVTTGTSGYTDTDYAHLLLPSASPVPVPIPGTPANLLAHTHGHATTTSLRPSTHNEKDDGGPYKAEMVSRMEGLAKGERIMPPCDRCRRLHMDCLKNLTACMGCTKKHAKCSWKEVKESELRRPVSVTGGSDGEREREMEGNMVASAPPSVGQSASEEGDSLGLRGSNRYPSDMRSPHIPEARMTSMDRPRSAQGQQLIT